jgi:Arc/MetJ-type ribon-helix-helix transcriptional regulator|tara:strand:- start:376 stop:579 length:204 start_codon:yes stop_codon:yes gene_type:complete
MKTISIPADLLKKVEEKAKQANFTSAEDYIAFVLRKVLDDTKENSPTETKADEEEIRKNLKEMGYID